MLSYERIDELMSLLTVSFEHILILWESTESHSGVMLEYILQRLLRQEITLIFKLKVCTKSFLIGLKKSVIE
jgi:hypothetical protein